MKNGVLITLLGFMAIRIAIVQSDDRAGAVEFKLYQLARGRNNPALSVHYLNGHWLGVISIPRQILAAWEQLHRGWFAGRFNFPAVKGTSKVAI